MGLSEVFKKICAGQKTRAGEAGQAVVEYILVLIVTVSIILGILYQFNDAFKNFLDSYFGDYIACLLETGELPGLGGDGPTSSECNSGFQNFKLASGRPPKQTDAIGSQGGGSDSDPSSSGDGPGSNGSGGGRPASYNTAGNSPNGEAGFGKSNSNRPARQKLSTQNGVEAAAMEGSDESGFGSRRRRRRVIRRGRSNPIPEEFLVRQNKSKSKSKLSITKKTKEQRRIAAMRKAKFSITQPEGPKITTDVTMSGFSFGKILKFLIIFGILIAIFLFLGGQALQIKKSWQKSE